MLLADLPDELLERILGMLGARGCCRMAQTCSRVGAIVPSLPHWRQFAAVRWGSWAGEVDDDEAASAGASGAAGGERRRQRDAALRLGGKVWRAFYRLRLGHERLLATRMAQIGDELLYEDLPLDYQFQPLLAAAQDHHAALVAATTGTAIRFGVGVDDLFPHTRRRLEALADPSRRNSVGTVGHADARTARLGLGALARCCLRNTLTAELDAPVTQQTIETGALAVEAWMLSKARSVPEFTAELDDIAEQMRLAGAGQATKEQQLRHYLARFKELGFAGNNADYYNPGNSYLTRVLATKTGIPISLSVLFIAVCRRLGLELEPINFPRHFVLKWTEPAGEAGSSGSGRGRELFVDPFAGNIWGSRDELAQQVLMRPAAMLSPEYFAATTDEQVLLRMCRNLQNMNRPEDQLHQIHASTLMCTIAKADALNGPHGVQLTAQLVQLVMGKAHALDTTNHWDWVQYSLERLLQSPQSRGIMKADAVEGIINLCKRSAERIARRREPKHRVEGWLEKPRTTHTTYTYTCQLAGDAAVPFVGAFCIHRQHQHRCIVVGWEPSTGPSSSNPTAEEVDHRGRWEVLADCEAPCLRRVLLCDLEVIPRATLESADRSWWEPQTWQPKDVGRFFSHWDPARNVFQPIPELIRRFPDDEGARERFGRSQ